ncbi:hypothetical protein Poly24_42270 [Rosistilla carotiformis]|uniref:Hemin uptake protein hemP n=1 Tax=Rosistilla carotiformis TaxID=2528017 RepID=A0A518JY83_9BACT|nr:hemin uptake protein HemP [Rosistilla carotiformis]QDV70503.1 hypothetical protein Poly24_42270 [Rosistilla carotiformis]
MTNDPAPQEDAAAKDPDLAAAALNLPKVIQFNDLPRCGDEVWITSDGQLYRLRKTRQGKLILTK